VHSDVIRNIQGGISSSGAHIFQVATGAFSAPGNSGSAASATQSFFGKASIFFDASRVVPVGPQNSPETMSVRLLRRVA